MKYIDIREREERGIAMEQGFYIDIRERETQPWWLGGRGVD